MKTILQLLLCPWVVLWLWLKKGQTLSQTLEGVTPLPLSQQVFPQLLGCCLLAGAMGWRIFSSPHMATSLAGATWAVVLGVGLLGGILWWLLMRLSGWFLNRQFQTSPDSQNLTPLLYAGPWFFWWLALGPWGAPALVLGWWHRRIALEKQAGLDPQQAMSALAVLWCAPMALAALLLWGFRFWVVVTS